MTPRTRRTAEMAVGIWHDDLLTSAAVLRTKDRSNPVVCASRKKTADRLRDARFALRELRHNPITLPRNDCE